MKVLLVSDYATEAGGAEIQIRGIRAELRKRGHDARLFASMAGRAPADRLADFDCFGTTGRGRTLLQTANPSAAARLQEVVGTFKPDIVHVMMFLTQLSPLILPRLRGVPCIVRVVWQRLICPLGTKVLPDKSECRQPWGTACLRTGCLSPQDWLPLMLQKVLLHRWKGVIDLFLANSHVMKQALEHNGFGPAEVLWNGTPVMEPRGPLEDPPSVAFVGRLVPEKGVDVAIRAFSAVIAEVPSAELVIVGDGPERATAERLLASLQLTSHVRMCGRLSRADAELAVRRCWMQIAPSQWAEPFGNVAIEAQMRGTAVVASRSGGFCESVDEGHTGLLVPPHDDRAWAHAMITLLKDRGRAEAMGRAGRDRALSLFSESVMVDQLVDIYDRVIRTRATLPGTTRRW